MNDEQYIKYLEAIIEDLQSSQFQGRNLYCDRCAHRVYHIRNPRSAVRIFFDGLVNGIGLLIISLFVLFAILVVIALMS